MTLSEFKAWLEGYSASFNDGAPNADQWAKIAEKLDGIKLVKDIQPEPKIPSTSTRPVDWPYRLPKEWFASDEKRGSFFADPAADPRLQPKNIS